MSTAVNSTEVVLTHHLQVLAARDLDAIMSDYADDAVLFTPNGAFKGPEKIRAFFAYALELLAPVMNDLKVEKTDMDGEFVYVAWSAGEIIPFATDTFCIRDGKIVMQSFATKPGS